MNDDEVNQDRINERENLGFQPLQRQMGIDASRDYLDEQEQEPVPEEAPVNYTDLTGGKKRRKHKRKHTRKHTRKHKRTARKHKHKKTAHKRRRHM